jgi:hypothetical protein
MAVDDDDSFDAKPLLFWLKPKLYEFEVKTGAALTACIDRLDCNNSEDTDAAALFMAYPMVVFAT